MHLRSSFILLASLIAVHALALPHPNPDTITEAANYNPNASKRPIHYSIRHRRSPLAEAYMISSLTHARRSSLQRRAALPSPQVLAVLGDAAKTGGQAVSKAPEKAGNKSAKEQGKNATDQQDKNHQATAEKMAEGFRKQGNKDVDVPCLKRMVDTLSMTGGNNGDYSSCWQKPASGDVGVRMDEARKKVYGGK